MRTTPTITIYGVKSGTAGIADRRSDTATVTILTTPAASGDGSFVMIGTDSASVMTSPAGTANYGYNLHWVANAEL